MAEIRYVDQTLRDGQQSHWGMRMQAGHMLAVAREIDATGYHAIDITGSSHMEVLVRYQRENPWKGLDAIRAALPNATLRAGMRANGVVGMGVAPDSVIELWVKTLAKHGIGSVWIMDCLHDVEKLKSVARMARSYGVAPSPQVNYSDSPVHTDEYYADVVRGLAGEPAIESIILGDETGVLSVERAHTWIPKMVEIAGDVPVELHIHNATGQGTMNHIIGVQAGATIVHTAVASLANGPSMPSTQVSVDNMRRLGHDVAIDDRSLDLVSDHMAAMARREGWVTGVPAEYRLSIVQSQFPGGMMGTLRNQLERDGLSDRLPEVLDESIRVRAEMGYPVMATPFSQLVGIQALLNVVQGERYATIPDENLQYLAGWYGPPVGEIDPDLLERAWSTERGREIRDGSAPQPSIDEVRERFGPELPDEELLLRYLIPGPDVDAMYAADQPIEAFAPGGELGPVGQLMATPDVRTIDATVGGLHVSLRR